MLQKTAWTSLLAQIIAHASRLQLEYKS